MTRGSVIASLSPDAQKQIREQIAAQESRKSAAAIVPEPPKPSKYRNVRTLYKSTQGFERWYDSRAEADYAAKLDDCRAAGLVKWWLPQVRMPLPGGVVYVVDFVISLAGETKFRDVKGKDTQVSINKRKQVFALYGINVEIASLMPPHRIPLSSNFTAGSLRSSCQYPLWENNAPPDFRFCGAPVLVRNINGEEVRSSYCKTHHSLCLVPAKHPLAAVRA